MIQLNSKNQTSINKVLNPICLIFISTRDINNQIKKVEIYFIKEKNHQKISGGLNSNWFMKQSIQLIGI